MFKKKKQFRHLCIKRMLIKSKTYLNNYNYMTIFKIILQINLPSFHNFFYF